MSALFEQELAVVRARLGAEEPVTPAAGGEQVTPTRPEAFGHRAGLDAFMTGYAFGCYALESSRGPSVEAGGELEGLAGMKNKLASRSGNWNIPLCILKSHFAKTSSTHHAAQERKKEMLRQVGRETEEGVAAEHAM
jgi:hypothetical protein